ncbi:MAG TPA: hypothetical protein VE669_04705, partial [Actinomycetota bacterium]|nr:hypothetical protein [Actinomycetota bacterium]
MLAVAWGQGVVLLWAAGVAGMAAAASWWARSAWSRVTVEAGFEPARAFAGEEVVVRVRIENAKRLPLPIVRVLVRFPDGLLPEPDPVPTALRGHRRRLSVAGRSVVTLRLPVVVEGRGEYWLDDVSLELSDPFDLAPMRRDVRVERPLLVMPEPR